MAVYVKPLLGAKTLESIQTTQYTANGLTAIIDKITATNYSSSTVTVSVNIVTSGSTASNDNLITKTKTLQPSETYTFPELVGQVLAPGGFVSTIASLSSSVNMRISGREVTY